MYDILEKANYSDSIEISGCQWLQREKDKQVEHRGFLGH